MAHQVFISYAKPDKKMADTLCTALESHGIRCWIAPRDVIPGRGYGAQILQAIEASKLLVLVLSANSNASQHVTREIERAVNDAVSILAFRIEDITPSADLEYFISSTHWLDAFEPPIESHITRLVTAVRSNIGAVLTDASHADLKNHPKKRPELERVTDTMPLRAGLETREKAKRKSVAAEQLAEHKQREDVEARHRPPDETASRETRADNSERSQPHKGVPRWSLVAVGIATLVVTAVVMLQLRESPPATPPASANGPAANRQEHAAVKAETAKPPADAEIVPLPAEANPAHVEAEAPKARAQVEKARPLKKPAAAPARAAASTSGPARSQPQAAASTPHSDTAVSNVRSEASLAATRAKPETIVEYEAPGASGLSTPAPKAVASAPSTSVAVVKPPPAPAATSPEAGWIADRFCPGYSFVPAVKDQLNVTFKDGEFTVVTGKRGWEGYVFLRGKRSADGKLKLSGYQQEMGERRTLTSAPVLEDQYSVVEGQLESDRYQLKGQMAGRTCTMTISRR